MDTNAIIIEDDGGGGKFEFNGTSSSSSGSGFSLMKMEQLSSRLIQMPPPPLPISATLNNGNIRDYRDLCITSGNKRNITTTTTTTAMIDCDNRQQPLGPILELDGQLQSQKQGKLNKLSGMIETSVRVFIHGKSNNCLPACLLGATLVAATLNIILLSFVVKSIQLNDRGFIGGKISWDDQTGSTIFRLAIKLLGGKSISIKSIESPGDRPLKLETLCLGQPDNNNDQYHAAKNQQDSGGYKDTCRQPAIQMVASNQQQPTDTKWSSKLNYTAVNVPNQPTIGEGGRLPSSSQQARIEIETELLVWDLISKFETNQLEAPTKLTSPNTILRGGIQDGQQSSSVGLNIQTASDRVTNRMRLLEFDRRQSLISLPRENNLNLDSISSSSIMIVDDNLESPVITGSLEENLDIQTRNGNLTCRSLEAMKLVSKSGVARFSAIGDLVLSAPALVMSSSKQLYLPDGIQYFDSEPTATTKTRASTTSTNMMYKTPTTTANMAQQSSAEVELMATASNLRAYNLVSINGILMATTSTA